ncbi:MAG: hypothetical protein C5B48_15625 [Candidatus Rokuibacteriota bacterium]|nr:MAG: hypothetical protein C5B48_15625 [Candidatus Rokubacteria bacterium]
MKILGNVGRVHRTLRVTEAVFHVAGDFEALAREFQLDRVGSEKSVHSESSPSGRITTLGAQHREACPCRPMAACVITRQHPQLAISGAPRT